MHSHNLLVMVNHVVNVVADVAQNEVLVEVLDVDVVVDYVIKVKVLDIMVLAGVPDMVEAPEQDLILHVILENDCLVDVTLEHMPKEKEHIQQQILVIYHVINMNCS